MVVAASASGGREEIINYKGGDTGETEPASPGSLLSRLQ